MRTTRALRRGLLLAYLAALSACTLTNTRDGYHFTFHGIEASRSAEGVIPPAVRWLEVENRFGEVRVEAAPGGFGWSWELRWWSSAESDVQRFADAIRLRVEETGEVMKWGLVLPPQPARGLEGVESNLVLRVPREAGILLANRHGRTQLVGLEGGAEVRTAHGALVLEGIGRELQVTHAHGSLEAEDVAGGTVECSHGSVQILGVDGSLVVNTQHGRLAVERVSGDVEIQHRHGRVTLEEIGRCLTVRAAHADLGIRRVGEGADLSTEHGGIRASEVRGDVVVRNAHGDIRVESFGEEISAVNRHGAVRLELGSPGLRHARAVVSHGNLLVSVPQGCSPRIEASARHGSVRSELPLQPAGGGGALLELESEHGSIRVRRGD